MTNTVGFFGKLPSHGDFVHRRISQSFLEVWDRWLQQCIAESKARLGDDWLNSYLTSPIWHFSMSADICGPEPYQGLIMPSVDRVGRYFPLCIVATGPADVSPFSVAAQNRSWFHKASGLLLSCLDEQPPSLDEFDWAVKELAEDLEQHSEMREVESPSNQLKCRSWRLIDPPGTAAGVSLLRLADGVIRDRAGPCSLWWSEGSEEQSIAALVSQMLPEPGWYADMLTEIGASDGSESAIPEDWFDGQLAGHAGHDMTVPTSSPESLAQPVPAPEQSSAEPFQDLDETITNSPEHAEPGTGHVFSGGNHLEDLSLEDLINTPIRLGYRSGASTDAGNEHEENEDSLLQDLEGGLWLVADGMGGHAAGKTASEAVVSALDKVELPDDIDGRVQLVTDSLQAVNAEMRKLSEDNADYAGLGSTVAALVVAESASAIIWAGDTRVYRKRGDGLEQLTKDHSERQEMVERGDVLSILGPSNVITRAVGGADSLQLSVIRQSVQTGDRFLICSDGVYEELPPGDLAEILNDPDCQNACDAIIERVLEGRAKDNATALIVDAIASSG
jgi:type VI secretion system protein ImpM